MVWCSLSPHASTLDWPMELIFYCGVKSGHWKGRRAYNWDHWWYSKVTHPYCPSWWASSSYCPSRTFSDICYLLCQVCSIRGKWRRYGNALCAANWRPDIWDYIFLLSRPIWEWMLHHYLLIFRWLQCLLLCGDCVCPSRGKWTQQGLLLRTPIS